MDNPPHFEHDKTFKPTGKIPIPILEQMKLLLSFAWDRKGITLNQLFWLANRSPQLWGDVFPSFCAWMDEIDRSEFIPIDFRLELHEPE